ncbi:MobF family relaxase [Rhodococcus sp. ANT_H53B]|uniref:MobF family relaxase n=1 Tax=Rhodococcus sp. ANT_H53B TaxID=2597357 RepID=UPI0011EFE818|nr:MobF family relaxase [Rhodococcus sp. ANT_H53B]KAA0922040.1 AAA family ATPase [Rhodococcus sp. ANT_H53B]
MTLHVLHAGDGYEYLTKQVATADREREHGQDLTDYYTAHGTPPGVWFGAGLDNLEQMQAGIDPTAASSITGGGQVSEPQMKALFGSGLHPNASALIENSITKGANEKAALKAARLGRKFPEFSNDIELLREHKAAVGEFRSEHGHAPSKAQSQQIMDEVGTRLFTDGHGRPPEDQRELRSWISAQKSRVRQPVAGYDLVFTPPKSVSVMWALADDGTRREIERIHKETVTDALGWIEKEACFTRTGNTSQEVQDTTGLVATLYDHYDSRAGDPNLHTHAVVSIKVCTESDGKWRALDGSILHRYAVPASQRYNATIMSKLHTELGFSLAARSTGHGRQDIVEIEQVPRELCEMFSSRRSQIETRRDQLVAEYRAEHGRMPSPKAMYSLYQQANLDTRAGKQEPQTLREMQNAWLTRSAQILGTPAGVDALAAQWQQIQQAHASGIRGVGEHMRPLDSLDIEAARVVERLENARSNWAITHVHSAVDANFAAVAFTDDTARRAATAAVVDRVLATSVHMPLPELPAPPTALRRRDGEFILTRPGTALHTSQGVLSAERSLLDAAQTPVAYIAPQAALDKVITAAAKGKDGRTLNAGQRELAEHFVGSGTLVAVGIGPAGTGKTTAMKAVTDTWKKAGYQVIALAPSAVAAETLGEEIGVTAHTLATLTYPWRGVDGGHAGTLPEHIDIPAGAMLLVDEASLASTKDLAAITEIAAAKGAVVRLLGDPNQLDAVETGGTLRLLAEETRAPELTTVVRFGDDTEQAENSLDLRHGDPASLGMFYDRGWVHDGTAAEMKDAAASAYLADVGAGKSSIVMLSTRDDVREVNLAIQAHFRGHGAADAVHTVRLSDELDAGVGDTILTRRNTRALRTKGGRRRNMFVRNGDLWTVTAVGNDGSLTVRSKTHDGTITLPADYVRSKTELGYAATVHRSQGITVDTSHTAVSATTNRAGLYVALTRGRTNNELYVPVEPGVTLDTEGMHLSEIETPNSREVLTRILANDNGHKAAITAIRDAAEHANSPDRLREAYLAAHTRLRDHWLDTVLDRALPAALLATAQAEHPGSLAALRATLAEIHDRGDSARHVLVDALAAGELHTARDVARVLNSRIIEARSSTDTTDTTDTDTVAGATGRPEHELPPLPPRTPGTDLELDDYARLVADRYTTVRPAPAETDGIGRRIRDYDAARSELDTARVQRPIQAAFDPATAERLIAEPGVHRLGRHLRTAALAGLSPENVLAWHAQQLEARDIEVTAANLIRDVVPKITDAAARANSRWADEHAATLTEHFPMAVALAEHSDDPRWNTAIGRMRELTDHGGYDLDRLCTQITDATHSTRHGAGVLAALDDIAPPQRSAVDPAAPAWLPTPDLDAHVVDHAAADRLHADYAAITAEHVELTSRIAAAAEPDRISEFGFTAHLPARPDDDEQLTAEWNRTAADIAAYRDRGSVTDTTSVAGDRPDDRAEHATFNAVHRDIDTLAEHIDEHHRAQQEERIRQLREEHDIEHHRTLTEHNPVVEHDRQRRGPRM